MSQIAGHLGAGLDVRSSVRASALSFADGRWAAQTDKGVFRASAVVLTPPTPQSLELLQRGDVALPVEAQSALERIVYDPCIAVLALLDGPSSIPPPGGLRLPGEPLAWIADNAVKGISPHENSVIVHAGPEFSRERLESDLEETGTMILEAAAPWLGSRVKTVQVHRWRYSKPAVLHPEPCLVVQEPGILVFAGDAFAGPRVEGAALSGLAAAESLIDTRRMP
jgi:predicted NAD/FAD-dependent oxidoreductase